MQPSHCSVAPLDEQPAVLIRAFEEVRRFFERLKECVAALRRLAVSPRGQVGGPSQADFRATKDVRLRALEVRTAERASAHGTAGVNTLLAVQVWLCQCTSDCFPQYSVATFWYA